MASDYSIADCPPLPIAEGVEFRHVPNWVGYCVSNDGNVWSCKSPHGRGYLLPEWKRLKPVLGHAGNGGVRYTQVTLASFNYRKLTIRLHVLLLTIFVSPRPIGMEGRHIDGNPLNAKLTNLAWGTPMENASDKLRHGTSAQKLTANDVREIRRRYSMRTSRCDGTAKRLRQEFGICATMLHNIITRKAWGHIE